MVKQTTEVFFENEKKTCFLYACTIGTYQNLLRSLSGIAEDSTLDCMAPCAQWLARKFTPITSYTTTCRKQTFESIGVITFGTLVRTCVCIQYVKDVGLAKTSFTNGSILHYNTVQETGQIPIHTFHMRDFLLYHPPPSMICLSNSREGLEPQSSHDAACKSSRQTKSCKNQQ